MNSQNDGSSGLPDLAVVFGAPIMSRLSIAIMATFLLPASAAVTVRAADWRATAKQQGLSSQQIQRLEKDKIIVSERSCPQVFMPYIEPDMPVEEEPLTEEEQEALDRIVEESLVPEFIRLNPDPSEAQIIEFIESVNGDGAMLEDRILRRMIKTEINRTNNNPPIFDLEFDLILKEAVDALQRMARGVIRTGAGM